MYEFKKKNQTRMYEKKRIKQECMNKKKNPTRMYEF